MGADVRKQDLCGHRFDDGLAGSGALELAGVLRHHYRNGVLLARGHEPVRQPLGEIRVVERLPGLVDDDDGGAAILDLALDPAKEIGEDRHAFFLGLAVENAGEIEPDDIAFERERVFQRLPEDPAIAALFGPLEQTLVQIAAIVGGDKERCEIPPVP